jgi:hypothetical protein
MNADSFSGEQPSDEEAADGDDTDAAYLNPDDWDPAADEAAA